MSVHDVIQAALDEAELDYTSPGEGQFFVVLPGTHKLATNCWLVAGKHALLVEAFVCRKPDENVEEFYRFLLRRNARLYGVAFSIDPAGDGGSALQDGEQGLGIAGHREGLGLRSSLL